MSASGRQSERGESHKFQTFVLDKDYIIAYWVTMVSYVVYFLILLVTVGYPYNASLEVPWIRRIGLVVFIAGLIIWYVGRKKLGPESVDIDPLGEISRKILYPSYKKVHIKKPLVTDGIYAFMKHPQYWGTVLFYVGFSVALPSYPALAFALLVILPLHIWRARVEEKMNARIFGRRYEEYAESKSF